MSGQNPAANDAAELLYRHGIGSIAISVVASTFLSLIAGRQAPLNPVFTWWGLMTCVLILRAIDVFFWHKARHGFTTQGAHDIRRFGVGLLAAAMFWAAFPLIFFSRLNYSGRAAAAIILSGIAGGSATVLAPAPVLALIFCSALIWPITVLLLMSQDFESRMLGALGSAFFLVMAISSRLSYRATMRAIHLNHANEAMVVAMETERERTEVANQRLKTTQTALREMNEHLEFRIRVRTADLQREAGEKERYAAELAELASTDLLTGLRNRTDLISHLNDRIAQADLSRETIAVLFIDLDKFKEVNDVLGHYAGDRVLKMAADRLFQSLPEGCLLARWGGDEFVVVMPTVRSVEQVVGTAAAFRAALLAPIEGDFETVTIDATVGVALFPEHGHKHDELIWAADVAMYAGKAERRSKVRLFDRALSLKLTQRQFLEKALREATGTGAITVVFEPIVSAFDGSCQAMEALARWSHPALGEVPPSQFIPVAERTGDIVFIGRWALQQACREAATWPGDQPPAVSVNVSLVQILSGYLQADVSAALADSGLTADRLQIEVTESLFAGDHAGIRSVLTDLRRFGVRVALDDFGTGFSSISSLRDLPIDCIKIDRSFVQGAKDDSDPMLEAILRLAAALGFGTIAEGVETQRQADILISMKVGQLQGHLFAGGPLTPINARQWLATPSASVQKKHGATA